MNKTGVRDIYDRWHANLPVDAASDSVWHSELKTLLPPLAQQRVLEVACGRGGFTAWLGTLPKERRPAHLVASDFSPLAVQKAAEFGRTRGVKGVEYKVADLMALPWPNQHFDSVISCETIEHTPEPRQALRELHRVLKPGGHLYLTVPNRLNVMGLYRI